MCIDFMHTNGKLSAAGPAPIRTRTCGWTFGFFFNELCDFLRLTVRLFRLFRPWAVPVSPSLKVLKCYEASSVILSRWTSAERPGARH